MFFIGFPIFSDPNRPDDTIIGNTKPYANPSLSNLLSVYMQIIISLTIKNLGF